MTGARQSRQGAVERGRERPIQQRPSTADFDFLLPDSAIAQRPLPRGESRLLFLPREGDLRQLRFADLPSLLREGDRLVVNDTRVVACRLVGRRQNAGGLLGGRVEALLIEAQDDTSWWALIKPGRRTHTGARLFFENQGPAPRSENPGDDPSLPVAEDPDLLVAEVEERAEERFLLRFERPLDDQLERFGRIPLPPYIRRKDDQRDRDDYQTLFARSPGAIAAPTAGLHFTPTLLEQLAKRGIALSTLTLHVGPATFQPVTSDDPTRHRLAGERYRISQQTADEIATTRASGGRIVAVGTTSVRALESAARSDRTVEARAGATNLMILPGHDFRVVDLLVTNFHLPRSTLLMLVCAFAGQDRVLRAYRIAVENGYRFYSYGDAMLVERA